MSIGNLYTTKQQAVAKTILGAAAVSGLILELPTGYTHYKTNLEPEFMSKFPLGKIPALETKSGFKLFEGPAIARYISALVPTAGLLGSTLEDSALVDQWTHFLETEVSAYIRQIWGLLDSANGPFDEKKHSDLTGRVMRSLKVLEQHLSTQAFLVGSSITLADITFATSIRTVVAMVLGVDERKQFPNVVKHFESITAHVKLVELYAPITYTEKAKQYGPRS